MFRMLLTSFYFNSLAAMKLFAVVKICVHFDSFFKKRRFSLISQFFSCPCPFFSVSTQILSCVVSKVKPMQWQSNFHTVIFDSRDKIWVDTQKNWPRQEKNCEISKKLWKCTQIIATICLRFIFCIPVSSLHYSSLYYCISYQYILTYLHYIQIHCIPIHFM